MTKSIEQLNREIDFNYRQAIAYSEEIDSIHENTMVLFGKWYNERRRIKISINPFETGRSLGLKFADNTTYIEAYPQLEKVVDLINAKYREHFNVINPGIENLVETQITLAQRGTESDDIGRVQASASIIHMKMEEMEDIKSYFSEIYIKLRDLNAAIATARDENDFRDINDMIDWFTGKVSEITDPGNWIDWILGWVIDHPLPSLIIVGGVIWFFGSGTAEKTWLMIKTGGKIAGESGIEIAKAKAGAPSVV